MAEYKLSDIISLHEILLTNIKKLTEKYLTQKEQIDHYYDTNKVGFSISNFLNTLKHENRMLEDQVELYVNYMSFFHVSQKTQCKLLLERLTFFEKDMDENLSMNHTFSIEDISEKNEIDGYDSDEAPKNEINIEIEEEPEPEPEPEP